VNLDIACRREAARTSLRTVVVAAMLLTFLVPPQGSLAAPEAVAPSDLEVSSYQEDAQVSEGVARERLETQARGAGLVGEIRGALGEGYAGVWFDNERGEFVIPLVEIGQREIVKAIMRDDGLTDDYRFAAAGDSWEELEATQASINGSLRQDEELVFSTSLDVAANRVQVKLPSEISASRRAEVEAMAASAPTEVEVWVSPEPGAEKMLCWRVVADNACDKPLRGGVGIGPYSGEGAVRCTSGFQALGNTYGHPYIVTAGHCAGAPGGTTQPWAAKETQAVEGEVCACPERKIGYMDAIHTSPDDWAVIHVGLTSFWYQESWPNVVAWWQGAGQQPLHPEYAINGEATSYIGEYACHSGAYTGTSCGYVTKLNLYIIDPADSHVTEHVTEVAPACVHEGDSGGPSSPAISRSA